MLRSNLSYRESILMDVMRLLSALWVMVMHGYAMWFPAHSEKAFHLGHAAVVVFFVLSGFVIAFTTGSKNRGIKQYSVARLSRLSSVLIPSLIVTGIIEFFISFNYPALYQSMHRGMVLPRYIASSLYLNEVWFFSMSPPINAPLWSLSFEFWYYVIFGICFFYKKIKYWPVVLLAAFLIAGPKILLLMPIWLLGVAAYRIPKLNISTTIAYVLSGLSLILAALVVIYLKGAPFKLGTPPLFFAAGFGTDFLIGIFIAFAICVFPVKEALRKKNTSVAYAYFRKVADLTFPIYLLHNPLYVLFKTVLKFQQNSMQQYILVFTAALIIATALGLVMDKYRYLWNQSIAYVFNRVTQHPTVVKAGKLENVQ